MMGQPIDVTPDDSEPSETGPQQFDSGGDMPLPGGIMPTEDDGTPLSTANMDPNDPLYPVVQQLEDESAADEAKEQAELQSLPFDANLAEHMDAQDLKHLADDLLEHIDGDIQSRKEWAETLKMAVKELGLRMEHRTEPWDGASSITHSMLLETIIRFQAEAVQETFNSNGPSKPLLTGDEDPNLKDAVARISADINTLMTNGIPGYRTEHERMLFTLGLCGTAAKDIQFDPARKTITARAVAANDLIMAYDTPHLSVATRVTQRLRMAPDRMKALQRSGFYRDDIPIMDPADHGASITNIDDVLEDEIMRAVGFDITTDEDGRHIVYQVDWEGIIEDYDPETPYPWMIAIDYDSANILAIYRNWREGDPLVQRRGHLAKYGLMPAFGAYDLGYAHILLTSNVTATDITRQLIDSGTLANLPGGFKTRGMKVKGDNTPISPSEFRDVDIAAGKLQDNIMLLPYKEPSQTLYNLLGTVVDEGRRLGAVSDLKTADMQSNAPVGTTLAILERGLKPINAIQGRLYDALGDEIELIRGLLADYNGPLMQGPLAKKLTAKPEDYQLAEGTRIVPTIDPVSGTLTQRIAQFQSAYQLSQGAPDIYDRPALHRQMLQTLGVPHPELLVPDKTIQAPMDPVAENMAILNGQPVKAFESQDHEAHLAVHVAASKDPLLQQMVGQSPQASQIAAAGDAHIREHVAFAYKRRMEQTLGHPLPAAQTQQIDAQLAPQIAQASDQLLQRDQQQVAAQQAAQNAKDPVLIAQQLQQQNASRKLDIEEKKNDSDNAIKLLVALITAKTTMTTQDHNVLETAINTWLEDRRVAAQETTAQAAVTAANNAGASNATTPS